MPKKQSNQRATKRVAKDEMDGNVDKIRDILFGSQMRDYELRLDAMEKRITQSFERAARDIERRIERLDAYARREVDKLSEQIKTERKDRVAEGKKGASDLGELSEQVESWFAEADEQLASETKDLRTILHTQSEELNAQIREAHEQLQSALQKESAQLADIKLGREDMAALLTEVAMRLNNDFKLPKAGRNSKGEARQ